MTYFNKNAELKNGYNAYIDANTDDMGTQMDVGLLLMEDGDVDFDPVFKVLSDAGYQGWLLVEAEQDPAKANPLEYAMKGRKYIKEHTGL